MAKASQAHPPHQIVAAPITEKPKFRVAKGWARTMPPLSSRTRSRVVCNARNPFATCWGREMKRRGEVGSRRGAAVAGQLAVDEQPEVFDDVGSQGIGGNPGRL